MTNQEHWTAAKEQVANNNGYEDSAHALRVCRESRYVNGLIEAFYTQAAELMAQSIREEVTNRYTEQTAEVLLKKDKEIERLKGGIKKYVWQMDQFFSSPKVGQPPALKDLKDLL